MITIIQSKLISTSKLIILATISMFSGNAMAEYFIVQNYGCADSCCGQCTNAEVVYRAAPTRVYAPPVAKAKEYVKKRKIKKVKYYKKKRHGSYQMVKYYVWPAYVGAVVTPVPACQGGCSQQYIVGDCMAPSCNSFYVPPEYYTSVSNVEFYTDRVTADDFRY